MCPEGAFQSMIGSSSCTQCGRGAFSSQGAVICQPESTALRAETTATGRADQPTTSLAAALPASTESAQLDETPPQRPTAAQLLATQLLAPAILAATPALPASLSYATKTVVALPTRLGSPSEGAATAEHLIPQETASVAGKTTVIEQTLTASVAASTIVTQETVAGFRTTPSNETWDMGPGDEIVQCPLRDFFTCYGAAKCTYYVCGDVSTCPNGTYCDPPFPLPGTGPFLDERSVISCPAGYFSANGRISLCSGGYYCPEGTAAELPCPAGFSCPVGSLAPFAIQCPLRDFFTCYGAAKCTYYVCDDVSTCPSGTYCDPAVSSDTGSLLLDDGSVVSCPAGYFSENGSISLCSGGYYCPEGTAAELPCPAGFACPVGSPAPQVCLAGTFCSAPGLLTGPDCPAGSFCPIGASAPTPCPSGYFCPQASGSPFPCSAGAYCPGALATDQLPCPVGSYCPLATLAPVPCAGGATECPAEGTECPPSMPSCSLCAIQAPGNNCSAGGYCPQEGGGVRRLLCPPGSYCPGGTAAPIPCQDPRLCPYIPYIGLSVPLTCSNSRPAPGGGEYLANVSGLSYGEVCWFPEPCAAQTSCWSLETGVLCMPDTGAYCVVDTDRLPPGLQFMVAALNMANGPLEIAVFILLEVDGGAAAGPLAQLLDGQLPLTPCPAPSSAPVPICLLDFDFQCYKSYPIPEGMYLAPGTSFPAPIGQGYFTCDGYERIPCNPTWDNSKPLYWTQASGGRDCGNDHSDEQENWDGCYGAAANAQAVWHTEGPFRNPGWICSVGDSGGPCKGPACIGSVTWTRH